MKSSLSIFTAVLLAAPAIAQDSAYLPAHGVTNTATSYVFQTFEDFWVGKTKMTLPDDLTQHVASLSFDYGLTEDVALDLTVGYIKTHFRLGNPTSLDGLNDTRVGVRWQWMREDADGQRPTLALRFGGIIEGTYDTVGADAPINPGDGASGFELSLLYGKRLADTVTLFGDIGYRNRAENVPDDVYGSIALAWDFHPRWVATTGFRFNRGLNGLDIGGPGFDPTRFPEVKEQSQTIEAGLGYTLEGGKQLFVFVAKNVGNGRNVGDRTIIGGSFGFQF